MMVSVLKIASGRTLATLACALPLLTASCGSRPGKSSLLSGGRAPTPKPLIIGMSGYATCLESEDVPGQYGPKGHEMFKRITAIADYIKSQFGVEPAVHASCFTTERRLIVSSSPSQYQPTSPTDDEYLESTHQLMNDYSDIFVVGHSYGGWLAMKLMESWNGNQYAVKTIYTLDPISRKLCFFDDPNECLSAPHDILDSGRRHISDNSGVWVNPWQRNTLFLHSSQIAEADLNPQYDLTHWSILTDDEIWVDIRSRISL
jgi:hypothetical protein